MKGYRFFAEMPEERRSKSASKAHPFQPWTVETLRGYTVIGRKVNCIAVVIDSQNGRSIECVSSVYDHADSAVADGQCAFEYLRKRCVRVPEELARLLHPRLFIYLVPVTRAA